MVLVMCVSLLPTVALATSLEQNLGGNSTAKAAGTDAPSTTTPLSTPEGGAAAYALTEGDTYINEYGNSTAFPDAYTVLTDETTSLTPGWYVVSEDVTISGTLTIASKNSSSTVNLILCDNATLTVNGGVKGENLAELHIYAQSTGDDAGKMTVTGKADDSNAAIDMSSFGTLKIFGGVVTATLETDSGTAYGVSADDLAVFSGKLNATAKKPDNATTTAERYSGIYIDSVMGVSGGEVIATGGDVNNPANTTSNYSSTGITINGNSKTLSVSGGTVTATGGDVNVTTDGNTSGFLASSQGITAKYTISIDGTGQLNATGGNVTVTQSENSTGTNLNGRSCGIYQEGSDPKISLPAGSKNDNGKLTVRAGTVIIDSSESSDTSYDIQTTGNLEVDYSTRYDNGGTVQRIGGGAVKVNIGKNLTVNGTIQLAEGSRIYTSISTDSNAKFNTLLAEGCGYFQVDNSENSPQPVTTIADTTLSAGSGTNDYILIGKNTASVPYLDENGTTRSCVFYKELTQNGQADYITINQNGWYVVDQDTTIDGLLTIAGNSEVHIILKDNAALTVTGGVNGGAGKLYIYAQRAEDTTDKKVGKMTVTGTCAVENNGSAVISMDGGSLIINSGVVTAEATGTDVPNIGIYVSNLTVNGGKVTATGGKATGTNSYGIYITERLSLIHI